MSGFSQNYERALSGYTQDAGEINDNLANWRSDVDMTRQANKTGLARATSQAYNKVDMDAIKGVADEFGLQGGKKIYEKYVTKGILNSKFGGLTKRSFNDVDKDLGDRFRSAIKSKLGIGQSADEVGAKTEGSVGGNFSDLIKGKFGGTADEATQRLNNLRSGLGDAKSGVTGLVKDKVSTLKGKSRFGIDDDAEEMRKPRVSGDDMGDDADPFGRDQAKSVLPDVDEEDAIPKPGIRSTGEPVNTSPGELDDAIRSVKNPVRPLSTPEDKPSVESVEDLKGRFAKIQPKSQPRDIEMENRGEVKQPPTEEPDDFEGMDFGERKFQGVRPGDGKTISDPMDFGNEPALQPDALGGGNGGNSVGTRNAAGAGEQDAQIFDDGSDLAPYYQGLNRPSLVNATGNATGEGGGDLLKSGLKDVATAGGEDAVETGAGSALETAGAVLDATPFAPLGWLFGAVGLGLDAGAAYQAGKGVADWVSDDVLGNHPAVNFKKTKLPGRASLPKSYSITPTMDSSMDIGAGGGSW